MINFTKSNGPKYVGNHGPVPPEQGDYFKVVNWNIKFAEKVDTAIEEFQHVEALQNADLILLQEMDHKGVEQIAIELDYNYVYYPASIHDKTGREFGNAILSRWPINQHIKSLLPHESPINRQRRIVVGAVILAGDQEITTYSTHTETPILSRSKRNEQVEHIGSLIEDDTSYCAIIGGDFNTFSSRSIQNLEETMADFNLASVFPDPKITVKSVLQGFTIDHLFVRGFEVEEAGVWTGTKASDHFPVWVNLKSCTVPSVRD